MSLESLKGTCVSPSERAFMTIPRVTKELLMFLASSNRVPERIRMRIRMRMRLEEEGVSKRMRMEERIRMRMEEEGVSKSKCWCEREVG